MKRVLKIFSATEGLGSGPILISVDPADTRSNREICNDTIRNYKQEKEGFMSEPHWKQSLVRAGVFQQEAGNEAPVLVVEYNHVRGTAEVDPDVFTSTQPTPAVRI